MFLQLSDGVAQVTLSGGGAVRGCTYFPATPERKNGEYDDVTESAEITLRGTASDVRAAANAVERLLELAVLRQAGGTNGRVYLNYKPVDSDSMYRSEVLDGRLVWSSAPGLRRLGDSAPTVQAKVIVRRRYFWEGPEVELPSGAVTNGDGGYGNTLLWNGVQGTLPAPVRVTLVNASGASLTSHRFYVQNDAADRFGATGAFLYPAQPLCTWLDHVRHSNPLWRIDIPQATAAKLKGERHRILAAFDGVSNNLYLRANLFAVVDGVLLPMQQGPEVQTGGPGGTELLDLGALNLPPAGDIGSPSAYSIVLTGYYDASGGGTLRWVHVSPAAPSVTLIQLGFTLDVGGGVVHDGIEGVSYLSLAQRHPVVEAAGSLLLYPNQPNRIRILFDEYDNFEPSRALTVYSSYRPRRLTV